MVLLEYIFPGIPCYSFMLLRNLKLKCMPEGFFAFDIQNNWMFLYLTVVDKNETKMYFFQVFA